MRKVLAACAAVLVVATGCGSSTSEAPEETSVESLHREQSKDSKERKSLERDSTSSAPADKSAREVESLPGRAPGDPKEQEFFDDLKGIDTAGVEDQLVATAQEVCRSGRDAVVLDAVAGQLVEQGATDLNPDEVAERIAAAAEKAYC